MPGAAGLGVRRRCLRLWRPSGHQRSACRCYRFADPAAEDRYGAQAAGIVRDILRIYYLVVFLFAIQEFVTYIDHRSSAPFWTLLGISAGTLALLLLSWWKRLLPYALPLQTASIVVLSATLMYHIRNTSIVYNDRTLDYVFPAGTGPPDLGVGTRVAEQVRQFVGMVVMRDALMYNCIHWISLSVAGFSKWTVLSYVAVYFSTAVGVCENPFISEKVATMFMATVASLGFFLVSVVIERVRRSDFLAQAQLAHELQASQLADSVLNHMLKNALADVAADIEIFLAGELGPEVLEDAVVCLRRGIRSCRERMVYLKMVAGQYAPVLNAINLKEFGQQLAAGRTVTTDLVDCTVLMDGTLLQLILENDVPHFLSRALQEADIAILDQNLDYTNPYQGTELCGQLLAHGFRGLVCIRSSDDSQDDQAKYAASGAHCSFGKDLLGAKMVQRLKAAYVLHSGCHDVGSRFGTNRHEPRIAAHSTPPTSVFAWPPSHPLSDEALV